MSAVPDAGVARSGIIPSYIRLHLTQTCIPGKQVRSYFLKEKFHVEENLPAQQDPPQAHLRLPRPHEHPQRSRRHPSPPRQGAQEISSLVFPRRNRLVRRPDFVACYDKGRRLFTKHFVLFVLFDLDRTASPEGWRLGLAVTRKTGSAVRRNRVKRVLREFFRLHRALMPDGVDVIAVPKRHLKPERVTLALVTQELLPLLAELGAHRGAEDRTGPNRPTATGPEPAEPKSPSDSPGPEFSGPEPAGPETAASRTTRPDTAPSGSAHIDEARPDTAREAETGAQ